MSVEGNAGRRDPAHVRRGSILIAAISGRSGPVARWPSCCKSFDRLKCVSWFFQSFCVVQVTVSNHRWIGAWLSLNFEFHWLLRKGPKGWKGLAYVVGRRCAIDIYRPKKGTSLRWKIYIAHYAYISTASVYVPTVTLWLTCLTTSLVKECNYPNFLLKPFVHMLSDFKIYGVSHIS